MGNLYLAVALETMSFVFLVAAFGIREQRITDLMRQAKNLRAAAIIAVQRYSHHSLPRSAESLHERQGRFVLSTAAGVASLFGGVAAHWPALSVVLVAGLAAGGVSIFLRLSWQARQRRLASRLNVQATWLVSQLPAILAAVGDNELDVLVAAMEEADQELRAALTEVVADLRLHRSLSEALGPWRRSAVHSLSEVAAALPGLLTQDPERQQASLRELEVRVFHDLEVQVQREVERNSSWIHMLFGMSVVAFMAGLIIVPVVQSISSTLSLH